MRVYRRHEIKAAISRLKAGKKEGNGNFYTDRIINPGDDLAIHITCLFTAMTIHGIVASKSTHMYNLAYS